MTPQALVRKLQSHVLHRLGLPRPWVTRQLLGHQLVVRDGSFPVQVDYDDAWFYACAQHAEVVFDVGANVGHSALMALLCPSVKQVVLVDANWEALTVAAENLVRNQLSTRARFVTAFAAETSNQTVDFWTVGAGAAGSMYASHATTAARAGNVRQVSTVSLDGLATGFGVVPDLVKIDVEGAESKVLLGSPEIAAARKTRFIVEMHSMAELTMAHNASLVLDWVKSVGFQAWYLASATRVDSPEPIQHRGRCHLLLQPSDWPYPEWLATIPQSAALPS